MKKLTDNLIHFYEGDTQGPLHLITMDSIEYIKFEQDNSGIRTGEVKLKMKTKYVMMGAISPETMASLGQ